MQVTLRSHRLRFGATFCVFLAFCFLIAGPAQSGPAKQVVRSFTQPDGTLLELRLWGDEFTNGWETLDGHTVLFDRESGFWEYAIHDEDGALVRSGKRVGQDLPVTERHLRPTGSALRQIYSIRGISDPGLPRLKAPPAWASGTTNILVIMVEFPADGGTAVPCSFTPAQMQANLFGGTPTGPGNLTDYYDEISFGALDLQGTVVGCFTVAHNKNYYDDGPGTAQELVAEAIALADASVDFAAFDNDGNGEVDMVAISYAGGGSDNSVYFGADPNTNNLWPHAWHIAPVAVDGGARTIEEYFVAPELRNNVPTIRTIGVYAHEFGHKLGLPDLYDTDSSSEGIGHWGLMGSGSWTSNNPGFENGESPSHMTPWSKWFLGWISPTDLTGVSVGQAIPQAETNPFAVRLLANPGGPDDWQGSGEYFLIENRQQTGFDIGLDGCGILVWHIDEAQGNNASEGHTAGSHRLVDLEEADGNSDLDGSLLDLTGNRGDAGDPFPGTTNQLIWDDNTTPHARLYSGANTGLRMALITDVCAATMTATFGNQPPQAVCQDLTRPADANCLAAVSPAEVDNGSSDPDGDPLTLSLDPPGPYGLGTTDVTLTVTDDKGESSTCNAEITVNDVTEPDIISCPDNVTVECTGIGGTPKDDDQLIDFFAAFDATDNCDNDPDLTNDAPDVFPAGMVTTVIFTATDDAGNTNQTCSATVEVVDTTPPDIMVELDRDVLWPPNHMMAEINANITASDICCDNVTTWLDTIFSDEPDNGRGDGNTSNDIQDADYGNPVTDTYFLLRSERMGKGDGRVYTVIYTAADCFGNEASDTGYVRVPHDQSGAAMASFGFESDGTGLTRTANRYVLVIPSTGDVDATQIDIHQAMVGNLKGIVRPEESLVRDVDHNGLDDLALYYSVSATEAIINASEPVGGEMKIKQPDSYGLIGLHYVDASGTDRLVPSIFDLGPPVSFRLDDPEPPDPYLRDRTEDGLTVGDSDDVPSTTMIKSIYPNPFNPSTTVEIYMVKDERVKLRIYDTRGALIRRLEDGILPAGQHRIVWNGRDDRGGQVATGVYFVRFEAGSYHATQKVVLLK